MITYLSPTTLAYRLTEGVEPTIVFLPGYASDMTGTKALALEAWAKVAGRAFLRFDYTGCGASAGDFAQQTLAGWRDDVLAMLDGPAAGPVVLVGSSMGGSLMLLVALARPQQVVGLVGIAAAPDFTDWGFTHEEKQRLLAEGRLTRTNPYGPEPTLYTHAFCASGDANRLMSNKIAIDCPVRLIQGMADPDVPYEHAIRLATLIRSADVQLTLVKDGDHRLSRDADIARMIAAVEDLV